MLRNSVMLYTFAYLCNHGLLRVGACESVLQFDVVRGKDTQQIWFAVENDECVPVGVEAAKHPIQFKLHPTKLAQGISFSYLIPLRLSHNTKSEVACPLSDVECRVDGRQCRKEWVSRGWGNGCTVFGRGAVCTCVEVKDAGKQASDYIWIYLL